MNVPRWLSRLWANELVGTFAAIACYLAYIGMDGGSLYQLVTERLTVCQCADLGLVMAVAARVATLMTFGLLVILFVIRRPVRSRDHRVLPNLFGLAGFGLPVVFMFLARAPADVTFNIASSVVVLIGNAGVVLALSHLGRSLSILPQARSLVTSGPYALVRHPLYFFEIVAFWGIFLQFRSLGAGALVTAICCVQLARSRFEEKVLASAFTEYADYRRSVPLLVPRFGTGLGPLVKALRQSAPHLVGLALLFCGLFTAAVTVLPGRGWRGLEAISQQDGPVVTALTRPYATHEECDGVAGVMADNARHACPQCAVDVHCTDRLDANQEAAIAGRPTTWSRVRTADVTFLLPTGPDGRATCTALADQLRAAGYAGAQCEAGEPAK